MNIQIKSKDNQADWEMMRIEVFMKEQGFTTEFDDIDAIATHITIYEDGQPAGCARLYPYSELVNTCEFGRIAVLAKSRKRGYGKLLVRELEKIAIKQGYAKVFLSAQCHAAGMYEELGYVQVGEIVYDEQVPHIGMIKTLA